MYTMKTFIIVLITAAGVSSISRDTIKRGIEDVNIAKYSNLLSSPLTDYQYGDSGDYLKGYNLNSQDIFSQLTSHDLGLQQPAVQDSGAVPNFRQNQYYTQNLLFDGYKDGSFVYSDKGYANSIGLAAYGPLPANNNVKFAQPIQSTAPSHTRLTSSPVRVSYPRAITASSYDPIYPPNQPISSPPIPPAPITLGSGSLGITKLNNGNFALGSGSIGYGGSPPIVGQRPRVQQRFPVFNSIQSPFYK